MLVTGLTPRQVVCKYSQWVAPSASWVKSENFDFNLIVIGAGCAGLL